MKRFEPVLVFFGAAFLGVAGGWLVARQFDHGQRNRLFSPEPYRRHAALGWIAGQDNPDVLPVLRDYLAWEPLPALRRRARRIATTLEVRA